MPLTRLIYVSRPHAEHIGSDFLAACDDILLVSRRNNERDAITGALVAAPRCFAQVLEGRRGAVSETFARVCRDARHERIEILEVREIEERRFGTWSMAFCDLAGIPDGLVQRFRHGRDLDLAALSPAALLRFLEEATRVQADDNAILGAPRPRIDMADEIVFRVAS